MSSKELYAEDHLAGWRLNQLESESPFVEERMQGRPSQRFYTTALCKESFAVTSSGIARLSTSGLDTEPLK